MILRRTEAGSAAERRRRLRTPLVALAVLTLLVAGSLETLGRHDHQSLLPDHHCPVCRAIDAPADSPQPSIALPIALPDLEQALPSAPRWVLKTPVLSSHRLRGPPCA